MISNTGYPSGTGERFTSLLVQYECPGAQRTTTPSITGLSLLSFLQLPGKGYDTEILFLINLKKEKVIRGLRGLERKITIFPAYRSCAYIDPDL